MDTPHIEYPEYWISSDNSEVIRFDSDNRLTKIKSHELNAIGFKEHGVFQNNYSFSDGTRIRGGYGKCSEKQFNELLEKVWDAVSDQVGDLNLLMNNKKD